MKESNVKLEFASNMVFPIIIFCTNDILSNIFCFCIKKSSAWINAEDF